MSRLVKTYFEVCWSSIQAFPNDGKLQSNRVAPSQYSTNEETEIPHLTGGRLLAQKGARGSGLFPRRLLAGGHDPKPDPRQFFGHLVRPNGSRIGYLLTASWAYFNGLSGAGAVL
jgi:hypothetical protein